MGVYRPIDQRLIDVCRDHPGDKERIRGLLLQGADLYAASQTDPKKRVLAEILGGWRADRTPELSIDGERGEDDLCAAHGLRDETASGRQMVELLRFFIDNGAFPAKDGGQAALDCIYTLIYDVHDRYMFDAFKLLLRGKIVGSEDTWSEIMERVGTEESYLRCCEREHALENIFYALYELLDRVHAGVQQDILVWQDCIGLKLDGICCEAEKVPRGESAEARRSYFRGKLILKSGRYAAILEGCPNIYGCELLAGGSSGNAGLEASLSPFLDHTITGIRFHDTNVVKGTADHRQPHITLIFDHGLGLHVSTDLGEVPEGESALFFETAERL